VWWFLQDWIKVLAYVVMEKLNIFSFRTFMDPDTPAVAPKSATRETDSRPLLAGTRQSINEQH
jgi:hypothetical protein